MNKTRSKTTSAPSKPASKAQASDSASPRRKPARKTASGPWSEVANFVVTFESRLTRSGREERRITAHKMQEGGITATWIGAEQHPMCQWIAEHVGEGVAIGTPCTEAAHPPSSSVRGRAAAEAVAPAVPAGPSTGAAPLDIAIWQVRARPDGAAGFDIEATLDVRSQDGAPERTIEPRWPIEFYLRNLLTAQKSCLGRVASADRVDGGPRYAATLRQVRLPAGTYRIDCVTKTPGSQRPFAYRQGPVLQVA